MEESKKHEIILGFKQNIKIIIENNKMLTNKISELANKRKQMEVENDIRN